MKPPRMTVRLVRLVLAGTLLFGLSAAPVAARRVALVISNADYLASPLPNAVRDGRLVADRLRSIGFVVKEYRNLNHDEMVGLVAGISDELEGTEIGIIYFSGHALQYYGQNQLIPVDLASLDVSEIDAKKVPLNAFVEAAGEANASGLRLVILDACRTDPFSALSESISPGLSLEQTGISETLIAYATSPGEIASDGPPGHHGPYALAIARALDQQGLELAQIMRRIRQQVREATQGRQIPWVVGSVEKEYWPNATPRRTLLEQIDREEAELDEVLWWFMETSNSPKELQRFVATFHRSRFVGDARERFGRVIAQLRSAPPPVTHAALETRPAPHAPIPGEIFRDWPAQLPKTEEGLADIVTPCDRLASDFADPQRVAPGVRGGLMDVRRAIQACAYQVHQTPDQPRFLFQLGRVLEVAELHAWARHYYHQAAARGYSAALVNLGYIYIEGIGVEKKHDRAAKYYRDAAAMGNLRARTNIGDMFVRGLSLPKLPEEGALWYRLAAESGWVNAQNALADLYRRGVGVEKDLKIAAALYQLAALNGQRAAMHNLGRLLLTGAGVPQDRAEAHMWFERGVESGDRWSPLSYAQDLIDGGEAQQNPERTLRLLRLATARGNLRALLVSSRLYSKGEIVPKDTEKAYLDARRAELAKVPKSEDIAARLRAEIGPEKAARIDAQATMLRRMNGR